MFRLQHVLFPTLTGYMQGKYEEAMTSLAKMEKRAAMAESMLEAASQYQSGQVKAQPPTSPSLRYLSILD